MELPHIQYITHPNEDFSNLTWVDRLKDGGIDWIQLRIKEEDLVEFHPDLHYKATFIEIADLLREKTKSLEMLLTINDHPDIARLSGADGLHFGQEDFLTLDEKKEFSILGGTASSWSEIEHIHSPELSYLGVGPYRHTNTKRKIKPTLGLEGYIEILKNMESKRIDTPLFAIGGIEVDDIRSLREAGVYGIALSGLLHNANFDQTILKEVVKKCMNR